MLPKKRRIPRKDIETVVKGGKRFNSPHLLLYVTKNSQDYSQFSFSVSKKVCPNATARNKYRRRGYSIIQKNTARINPGFECLFVFKKGSVPLKFEIIEKEISELLYDSTVLI